MTPEDLKAQLEALGLPSGGWSQSPGGTTTSPILERQRQMLLKIRALLEGQIEADKTKLSELHATVQRIKHGGT